MTRRIQFLEGLFTIHRFPPDADVLSEIPETSFYTVSRTADELSILCPAEADLDSPQSLPGWRGFRIAGTLDFSEIGVLAELAAILAEAGVSIFAVSTYDTDYIFLKNEHLPAAREALNAAGYRFSA